MLTSPPPFTSTLPSTVQQPQQMTVTDAGSGGSVVPTVSNAALLQLQATLLQVAQTGNQQAIQQLQGLNALMQQVSLVQGTQPSPPQPQKSISPPLLPSVPTVTAAPHSQLLMSLLPFASSPPLPTGESISANALKGLRSTSVSPVADQNDSPPSPHRFVNSGGSSAFKPRGKRDREEMQDSGGYSTTGVSSGGNSSSGSSGSMGTTPSPSGGHHRHLSGGRGGRSLSLKATHLRADVREAVAASNLLEKAKGKAGEGALSRDEQSSRGSSGESSRGTKSSSSSSDDEQRYQEADDEDDSEERNPRGGGRRPQQRPIPPSLPPPLLPPPPLQLRSRRTPSICSPTSTR